MKKFFLFAFLILILPLFAVGLIAYDQYHQWNTPWGSSAEKITLDIQAGSSARQIAAQLHDKGVIPNEISFLIVSKVQGNLAKLKAGEYVLSGEQTPLDVIQLLTEGSDLYHELVIPEGFTQEQIIAACGKTQICSPDELRKQIQHSEYFSHISIDAPAGMNPMVEGVLFPDTYHFQKNTSAQKVFTSVISHFESVNQELLDQVDEDTGQLWWQDDRFPKNQQIHKYVVLASIIEKEAKRDQDRDRIASVFVNRLQKNMPLQSDATIHYALNDWRRKLTRSDLAFDSPYNTYKNKGLPPAAICNPGRASLQAAMHPADTDYLYFIANPKGETLFTSTYREHINLKNKLKRERNSTTVSDN